MDYHVKVTVEPIPGKRCVHVALIRGASLRWGREDSAVSPPPLGSVWVDASRSPFGPHQDSFRTLQIRETKCPF